MYGVRLSFSSHSANGNRCVVSLPLGIFFVVSRPDREQVDCCESLRSDVDEKQQIRVNNSEKHQECYCLNLEIRCSVKKIEKKFVVFFGRDGSEG